ncbi:hypothetical protein D3C87_1722370 [compost metagenome]
MGDSHEVKDLPYRCAQALFLLAYRAKAQHRCPCSGAPVAMQAGKHVLEHRVGQEQACLLESPHQADACDLVWLELV